MRARFSTAPAVLLLVAAPVAGDIATFDSFEEGPCGSVIVDAGITFTNLDRRLEGHVGPESFVIEDAFNMLRNRPGFTPRNALGFGVYSPGEPVTFSRLGSLDILPARPAARIALNVYEYGDFTGCTIDVSLTRAGAVVESRSIPVVGGEGLHIYRVDIDGNTFDAAHLSIGPTDNDHIFALIDSVTIDDAMPCAADWNADWSVTSADFFAFLEAFFGEQADFNADGVTDSRDFFEYIARYFNGC